MKQKIYIVGAHSRARTLAAYLRYLCPELWVEAYLYDKDEENEEEIDGTPVVRFDEGAKLHTEYPVYIGTRGVYHKELEGKLKKLGMRDIRPVTVELDIELRNRYLKRYFASIGRKFWKLEDLAVKSTDKNFETDRKRACVYVVNSTADKPLRDAYEMACYERPIQVGAALTDRRLSQDILTDDTGDNISRKNKQYCELTALYWIWKHAEEEVAGLAHYRRHFLLPKDWLERMLANGVDAILPTPLYVAPSLEENYKNRHDAADFDNMMDWIQRRRPEDYREVREFFRGNLYSPCNMLIARKEVIDKLCSWLFPILDAVSGDGGWKDDSYRNRYPGFLSERMMSFFFEKYREKYKVVYADKSFLA